MNLFPMIQPELELKDASLPMYKEIAWDFEHNIPIYKNGSPKWITGKEAVLVLGLESAACTKNIVIQFTVGITDVS